jgi:TolA-binding protein
MNARSAIGPLFVLALLLDLAAPAWAQVETREGIALQNQILELQHQVQSLQAQVGRGGTPTYLGGGYAPPSSAGSSDLMTQLLSRVGALEDQVRQLRGRVDELQNQTDRQSADLGKRIDDLGFQVQNPGSAPSSMTSRPQPMPQPTPMQQPSTMSPPPGALTPQGSQAPPQAPPAPARRTPELAIQDGNAALARRDYQAAEQAAREVLTYYRTSPRAYDAQFLLAQALIGQRQFSQAAIAYDDTYNRSRRGGHAEDALLGLANSLIAINEKKAACDTLGKLRTEFPSPRLDLREPITNAAQRGGCR